MRNYLDRRRIRRVSASALGFGSNAANNLLPDISAEFDKGIYTSNRARLDFSELLTFARSSTATYVDSTGTLQTAAANEARTNHHVWNGASFQRAGMLQEGDAATNLITDNDVMEDRITFNAVLTASYADSPFGTNTAIRLIDDNSSGTGDVFERTANLTVATATAPHFYHAAQYCGAVPVKKEIEKLQRAKNLAPAIRDRHIQALEQGRILR